MVPRSKEFTHLSQDKAYGALQSQLHKYLTTFRFWMYSPDIILSCLTIDTIGLTKDMDKPFSQAFDTKFIDTYMNAE